MSEELKVTAQEIATLQIEGRENPMVCTSPEENQAKFDLLPKKIAEKHNALADRVLQIQTDFPQDAERKLQQAKEYAAEQDKAVLEKCLDYTNSVVGDSFAEAVVPADSAFHTLEGGVGTEKIEIRGDGVNAPCYFEVVFSDSSFFCPTDNNGAAVFSRSDVFVIANGKALLYKGGLDSEPIEYVLPEIFAEAFPRAHAVSLYADSALQCVVTYRKAAVAALEKYSDENLAAGKRYTDQQVAKAVPKKNCIDTSEFSVVSGDENENHGEYSVVVGRKNYNEGENGFIAGYGNRVELLDPDNNMSSNNPAVFGSFNVGRGIGLFVAGRFIELTGNYKFGAGTFNKDAEGLIFQIGNGESADKRSNAMAVDDKGNLYLQGDFFDDVGRTVYPAPYKHVSGGKVLSAAMRDKVDLTAVFMNFGHGETTAHNRIVVRGNLEDYIGREFIRFRHKSTGKEYMEKITSISERTTDEHIQIEFSANEDVKFNGNSASGNSEYWRKNFGEPIIFNLKVEWSDDIEAKSIVSDTADFKELRIQGTKAVNVFENPDETDSVFAYAAHRSLVAGTEDFSNFMYGLADIYNRIVIPKNLFTVAPETVVGHSIRFYTSETEYVTEIIGRVEPRASATELYNVGYTHAFVPAGIDKETFIETYCKVEILNPQYEWQPVEDIRQSAIEQSKMYTDETCEDVKVYADNKSSEAELNAKLHAETISEIFLKTAKNFAVKNVTNCVSDELSEFHLAYYQVTTNTKWYELPDCIGGIDRILLKQTGTKNGRCYIDLNTELYSFNPIEDGQTIFISNTGNARVQNANGQIVEYLDLPDDFYEGMLSAVSIGIGSQFANEWDVTVKYQKNAKSFSDKALVEAKGYTDEKLSDEVGRINATLGYFRDEFLSGDTLSKEYTDQKAEAVMERLQKGQTHATENVITGYDEACFVYPNAASGATELKLTFSNMIAGYGYSFHAGNTYVIGTLENDAKVLILNAVNQTAKWYNGDTFVEDVPDIDTNFFREMRHTPCIYINTEFDDVCCVEATYSDLITPDNVLDYVNVKTEKLRPFVPVVDVKRAATITVAANTVTNIAQGTNVFTVRLGEGEEGRDNQWVFTILQGAYTRAVNMPAVHWLGGTAPTFTKNTTTMCRLFYIRDTLCGEWAVLNEPLYTQAAVMPVANIPYAANITVAPNQKNTIAQTEGSMEIALADGVTGRDNEWVFVVNQGEIANDIVLPEIDWYLGIAPTFLANTSTEVRLFYKNGVLSGVYF